MSDNERTSLLAEAFLHHVYAPYDNSYSCVQNMDCNLCPYLHLCDSFNTDAHTFDDWQLNLLTFMQRTDFINNHPHLFI